MKSRPARHLPQSDRSVPAGLGPQASERSGKIRILLVDDHLLLLHGLRGLLEACPDFEVVSAVRSGAQAIEAVERLAPDVVLLDFAMPELDGLATTRRIMHSSPRVRVVCLSMHAGQCLVSAMLEAGAAGYLTKHCGVDEIRNAVVSVCRGETYLSSKVTRQAVAGLRSVHAGPIAGRAGSGLTARQRDILGLLADGKSTREVAESLGISQKTVGCHRAQILDKLNVRGTAELTKYAIREGLTELGS